MMLRANFHSRCNVIQIVRAIPYLSLIDIRITIFFGVIPSPASRDVLLKSGPGRFPRSGSCKITGENLGYCGALNSSGPWMMLRAHFH
jgi:hypothetical protein